MQRYWDGNGWTDDRQPRPAERLPAPAPGTGKPAEKKDKKGSGCGTLIVALIVLGVIAGVCGDGGDSSSGGGSRPDTGEAVGAWVVCQQFVEDRLQAPATAEYPSGYSNYTTALGGGRFRVDAYVDAENGFGALIRTDFSCTVNYQGNDNWRLENLTFEE